MPDFSFEKINYSVRPNKSVERKLLLQLFQAIGRSDTFRMDRYRYIGFGSMWFVDFSLMHRVLHIQDLLSIEMERSRERRVRFNRPFECVSVAMGTYSEVFPTLIWEKQSIVWLDYDGDLSSDMFDDLKRTVMSAPSGSIILVSANADVMQLRSGANSDLDLEENTLRNRVGSDNLPIDARSQITRAGFASLVGTILSNAFLNDVAARPGFHFERLVNISYADNAPMVTFGGILLNSDDRVSFSELNLDNFGFIAGPPQLELSVPLLTPREKLSFDQLVPKATDLSLRDFKKKLKFDLKDKEISSYIDYYLHYPLYAEYQI